MSLCGPASRDPKAQHGPRLKHLSAKGTEGVRQRASPFPGGRAGASPCPSGRRAASGEELPRRPGVPHSGSDSVDVPKHGSRHHRCARTCGYMSAKQTCCHQIGVLLVTAGGISRAVVTGRTMSATGRPGQQLPDGFAPGPLVDLGDGNPAFVTAIVLRLISGAAAGGCPGPVSRRRRNSRCR
jgi:hypothetical protein